MGEESSAITFEAIYDIVRKEKTTETIQKLNPNIYQQMIQYLRTKIEIYRNTLVGSSDKESLKEQINTARRLIKEFYERRERKILLLAINKSRTKADISDESALLEEEKPIYNEVTDILNKYRKDILINLVNAKLPFGRESEKQISNSTVRFLMPVKKFVGTNLEIYGPFEKGDIAVLPKKITSVLLKRDAAEEISV
jgi:DNA replication initiation complex subunit (GINS family)